MNARPVVWLIFPVVLTAMSVWLIVVRATAPRLGLRIFITLCILGCVRQAFLLWTKGQKGYASFAFAAAVISMLAGLVSFFHFN